MQGKNKVKHNNNKKEEARDLLYYWIFGRLLTYSSVFNIPVPVMCYNLFNYLILSNVAVQKYRQYAWLTFLSSSKI